MSNCEISTKDSTTCSTGDCRESAHQAPARFLTPQYEVKTEADGYRVRVELPGVPKDRIKVSLEEGYLVLTGAKVGYGAETWTTLSEELGNADYRLKLKVNAKIDQEGVSACSENGVLSLVLPKQQQDLPRQISIR